MNSKILKLDQEIKDFYNKTFEQALERSEKMSNTLN